MLSRLAHSTNLKMIRTNFDSQTWLHIVNTSEFWKTKMTAMDEYQKCYIEQKKPETKKLIFYESILFPLR